MLNGADVRQITTVAPLFAAIYYDFANPNDPNNDNIELSVNLSGKQDVITGTFTNTLATFATPAT